MRDYLEPMLGTTGALIAQFAVTLLIILALILVVFWLIRRFSGGRFGANSQRGRQPRLSVLDALPIDQRRRLVLIRRDNVEHLLLIGGPSDVVVEAAIVRAPPGQRRMEGQPRPAAAAQPAPKAAAPLAEPPRAAAQAESRSAEPRQAEARMAEPPRPEPEAVEPEPAFTPAPEPVMEAAPEPVPAPAERAPQAAAPARSPRGVPAFLTGGRSRQPQTEESAAARRESRNRVLEQARPLQRSTSSPFGRDAARPEPARSEAESEPVAAPRQSPFRSNVPPAPPLENPAFGEEPYGLPDSAPAQPLRFEPMVDREPELALQEVAPEVEPPTRDDQPVGIDEAFDENAPILSHGGRVEPSISAGDESENPARNAQVGDLEKEMARLLGEISGNKR